MKITNGKSIVAAVAITLMGAGWCGASSLSIKPEVFDFGWTPDNTVVACDFILLNTGEDMIALTAVQPSCGCTATNFTPEALPASEQMKVNITFNTRGYTNIKFDKAVRVKFGTPEEESSVRVKGHVANTAALVRPDGDGVILFGEGKSSKQKFNILNLSSAVVTLSIVQPPAAWIQLKGPDLTIQPGQSLALEAKVSDSEEKERNTSVTFEASGGEVSQRLTLAFQSGKSPEPYRRVRNAPTSPRPSGSPTPVNSDSPPPTFNPSVQP